jgi:hypothetical protein
LGAAAVAALGCNGVQSARLIDYLDELEFDVPLETAEYVPLGEFDIPISARRKSAAESGHVQEIAGVHPVWMRLQFELTAETTLAHQQAVLAAAERHRGALNDAVLTVVRTSSVDELSDPRLAAVNARLSEITRPMLGEGRVRQLVFNNANSAAAKHSDKHDKDKGHGGAHGGHDEHEGGGHGEAAHGAGHEAEKHEEKSHGHH